MSIVTVETSDGPGQLVVDAADDPAAVLLMGHGAGGDVDAWDLLLLAERLPLLGVTVVRYRQPYRVAGRKVYSSKPGLDRGWQAALAQVERQWPKLPLFTGGRSAGSRVACRGFGASQVGLVLLAFPLHPPGQPTKSRLEELAAAGAPTVVVQGEKDTFGTPQEVQTALWASGRDDVRLVSLPKAGHSLGPSAGLTPDEIVQRERMLIWSVSGFIDAELAARRAGEA